jgi:hypothetical protein
MTTATTQKEAAPSRLDTEEVWRDVADGSFAVLSYATPSGDPRSCGVVYTTVGHRLYIATAPDSWKARHIARSGRVAVTVPVRRGGVLALVLPIPPAVISFHGTAIVHRTDAPEVRPIIAQLESLLPKDGHDTAVVIEVVPEGAFVTYGVGVSLTQMRDPAAARAKVPVPHQVG